MHDSGTTFKLRVNLVQVHVVVRDSHDKPVDNLRREDFQVFDQGKLQAITNFSVETQQSRRERAQAAAKTQASDAADAAAPDGKSPSLPERFVALFFDDIHLQMEDVLSTRKAAEGLLKEMSPSDRIAIYSSSGHIVQEFTTDRAALEQALIGLTPRPLLGHTINTCPDMTHYMADQILNKNNDQVLAVAAEEVVQCQFGGNETMIGAAQSMARNAATSALTTGDTENEYTYRYLGQAVRVLSSKPGDRVLVLISPGFLLTTLFNDEMDVIDRANRGNIVINTIDARGLYTPALMGDISNPVADTVVTAGPKASYRIDAQFAQQIALQDFAAATGGTFFHNRNDLEQGLKMAAATPEVTYVLGFSPQNQKMDGRYHEIKVKLIDNRKYTIQARRGYYAPRKEKDPTEQAKQEIQEAVFSQDEIHDLPFDFQTQYFKTADAGAHLSVVSRLEVKEMHFRKADGRNVDELTMATAIFDENGNFVTGGEKVLTMRLLDTTYDRLSRTGLTVKSSFDVKPGRYMVRQVIRDSEGAQMAARNGVVAIPF